MFCNCFLKISSLTLLVIHMNLILRFGTFKETARWMNCRMTYRSWIHRPATSNAIWNSAHENLLVKFWRRSTIMSGKHKFTHMEFSTEIIIGRYFYVLMTWLPFSVYWEWLNWKDYTRGINKYVIQQRMCLTLLLMSEEINHLVEKTISDSRHFLVIKGIWLWRRV